jgi:peptidoglycan hydrolase-like protein with peptidoglycan-binding domain
MRRSGRKQRAGWRGRMARRWLAGAGAATAAGAVVLSLSGLTQAATAGSAAPHTAASHAVAAHETLARAASAHAAAPAAYVPVHHVIYFGARGPAVRRVQERLGQLHYYPGKVDGQFGQDTLEAVWAFKEVQGIGTGYEPNDIGLNMQQALVHPRLPRVLRPGGGSNLRVEVNQNIEVLVLYHHNKVELISHVSTGGGYYYPCPPPGSGTCGPAITPDGSYRAHWFAPGWLQVPLGMMYNPVFFIGGAYAIHGDVPVPLYPASHGCVRIPMDISQFFHRLIHVAQRGGTPIYISGHV